MIRKLKQTLSQNDCNFIVVYADNSAVEFFQK